MPIKTNMKSLTPRRQVFKREITLISHGFSNPVAWPGGKLVVFPWDSSIDEFLVEGARKMNRQELVYGLLQKVCDLNGAKVDDFVADEIQTVLLVSRSLATEGDVRYNAECPACRAIKTESIKIPDELVKVGEKSTDYPGYDDITLPRCADVLRIRPLLVKDERIIEDRSTEQRKIVSDMELRIIMPIITVNDSKPDNLEDIVTYYRALHPEDAKFLESEQRRLSPHLDTNIGHICDACGRKFFQILNFDQEFFR